jgi:hypothetical protein
MLPIRNSAPEGIISAAARSSAELNEPRRRLPETPMIVVTMDSPQLQLLSISTLVSVSF